MSGWIGVDLDGTLAHYDKWVPGGKSIGEPIPAMVERVKKWLAEGREVRIFTARVGATELFVENSQQYDTSHFARQQTELIQQWCKEHIGQALPVTAIKDFAMIELWDDRAVQVEMNTGRPVGLSTRNL